jgi:hypothetical protein
MNESTTADPRTHAHNIRGDLNELIDRLRRDVDRVDDPKAQALFETSAEVLTGLRTAFEHFEEGHETAWR